MLAPLPLLLAALLAPAACSVLPSAGHRWKVVSPGGRQVVPSQQQILDELQYLIQTAEDRPGEYGLPRDRLDQLLASGLDQLASVVPLGQQQPVGVTERTPTTTEASKVPIIDPGLFVIQGVKTCDGGAGYCMLGYNCTSDVDFLDDPSGHCDGLRNAFTPSAHFSCCRFDPGARLTSFRTTPTTTEGTTFDDGLIDNIVNFEDQSPQSQPEHIDENSQIVDIVAIITDSTGIVDIVTRPYTGPWPPKDEHEESGVTLPFAKPGETFAPDATVGLNQNGVVLGSTPFPMTMVDAFEEGDLPPEGSGEGPEVPAGALLTTAGTTVSSVGSSTSPAPPPAQQQGEPPREDGTVEDPLDEGLGPLAAVPVMDQSLDYIGELDYDQHLLPALMPIRPGTKAGGVQAGLVEGSGADPDELLPAGLQPELDPVEGSGSPAAHPEELKSSQPTPAAQGSEVGAPGQQSPVLSPGEQFALDQQQKQQQPAPVAQSTVASEHGQEAAVLSPGEQFILDQQQQQQQQQPACGRMGSSLASLLARSRYRISESGARIVGGEVTSTVVWCWMAAIMRRTGNVQRPLEFVCTGTLVERDLVLTTASCATSLLRQPLRDFVVLLGASNLSSELDFGVQHLEIEQIALHEDYQLMDNVHANDIGIIKLAREASLARTVCLLCLPPESMELMGRQSCTVTGYGLSDAQHITLEDSDRYDDDVPGVLRQATLPVLPRSQCPAVQQLTARHPYLSDRSFICAGGQLAMDACYIARDGGSPLACMAENGRYYLYGLVSWGTACGQDHTPQLYTNVANYFSWIHTSYQLLKRQSDGGRS